MRHATQQWVTIHTWMRRITLTFRLYADKESCCNAHTNTTSHEPRHTWMSHEPYINESQTTHFPSDSADKESCCNAHTNTTSHEPHHTWMSHEPHINESQTTHFPSGSADKESCRNAHTNTLQYHIGRILQLVPPPLKKGKNATKKMSPKKEITPGIVAPFIHQYFLVNLSFI